MRRIRGSAQVQLMRSCLALLFIAGCGTSDSDADDTLPLLPDVSGSWTYTQGTTDYVTQAGVTTIVGCFGTLAFSLVQDGGTFSGDYAGTISCNGGTPAQANGVVVNGTVTAADTISFDLDTVSGPRNGTLAGLSMGGTVTNQTATSTQLGDWSAVR